MTTLSPLPRQDPGDLGWMLARWQAAEGQLYPLAVCDPELYQDAVGLVVEVRDLLRDRCPTTESLVACDAGSVLEHCPSAARLAEEGFDAATAFDAARAYRWRELSGAGAVSSPDVPKRGDR